MKLKIDGVEVILNSQKDRNPVLAFVKETTDDKGKTVAGALITIAVIAKMMDVPSSKPIDGYWNDIPLPYLTELEAIDNLRSRGHGIVQVD